MWTVRFPSLESGDSSDAMIEPSQALGLSSLVWGSFVIALLQNVCGALIAINGLRLAIGVGALALSASQWALVIAYHDTTWIRFPCSAWLECPANFVPVGIIREAG